MVIKTNILTSANRFEHGRSDESNDEVARGGQLVVVTPDLWYSLHPVGTCTNAGTLGSDTEREDLGNESPGDRSPTVLLQFSVLPPKECGL
jgi:hypothetical protein